MLPFPEGIKGYVPPELQGRPASSGGGSGAVVSSGNDGLRNHNPSKGSGYWGSPSPARWAADSVHNCNLDHYYRRSGWSFEIASRYADHCCTSALAALDTTGSFAHAVAVSRCNDGLRNHIPSKASDSWGSPFPVRWAADNAPDGNSTHCYHRPGWSFEIASR